MTYREDSLLFASYRVCALRGAYIGPIYRAGIESVETRSEIRLTLRKSIGAHRRRVSDACKACPLQRRGYEKAPLTGSLLSLSVLLSLFLPENNPPNVEKAFVFSETDIQSVRETV